MSDAPRDILDAHLHLPTPWKPWEHGQESFPDLQAELLLGQMDAAGVDAAVLVSVPVMAPADACLNAVARHPDRLATVLTLDESAPDIADQVASAAASPGVLGLRLATVWPPGTVERLRAGAFEPLLAAAGKHALPLSVLAPGHLPDIAAVARAHPDLPLVIDHLGLDQPPYLPIADEPGQNLDQLIILAGLANVSVKISGAPTLSRRAYPYPDIWPHLERVLEAFGVDRCLWGTDYHRVAGRLPGLDPVPPYPGQHSYAEGLHYLLDRDDLSATEKAALFGGTARRVLNWRA